MSSAGRGGGRAGFGAEPDQEDPVPEPGGRKGKGDRLGLCLWPREGGGEGQGCSIHFDPSSLHLGYAELPPRCRAAAPTPPHRRLVAPNSLHAKIRLRAYLRAGAVTGRRIVRMARMNLPRY
ncbi:hypothetical protein DV515_00016056, partial [Chloebia gouldiae]